MANRFNFRILANKAAYEAISAENIDAMTFYLAKTGEGWLGSTSLFGGTVPSGDSNTTGTGTCNFNIISTAGDHTSDIENGKVYVIAADGVTVGTHIEDESAVATPYAQGLYTGVITGEGDEAVTSLVNITYKTIAQYITDNAIKASGITDSSFAGTETDVMTSAAVVKYVDTMINDQAILDVNFFKKVVQVNITQEDVDDVKNSTAVGPILTAYPGIDIGTSSVGDVGLVFIFDDLTSSGEDDGKVIEKDTTEDQAETYAFINLRKLANVYNVTSTGSTVTVTPSTSTDGHSTTFNVEVNKSTGLTASAIRAGADSLAEGNTYDTSALSENKFVTEKQLADLLSSILKDYVAYSTDEVANDTDDDTPTT